jgi:hypothetical protein
MSGSQPGTVTVSVAVGGSRFNVKQNLTYEIVVELHIVLRSCRKSLASTTSDVNDTCRIPEVQGARAECASVRLRMTVTPVACIIP